MLPRDDDTTVGPPNLQLVCNMLPMETFSC